MSAAPYAPLVLAGPFTGSLADPSGRESVTRFSHPFAAVVDFKAWPSEAGDPLDLPLLAWTLREENEPMELVLAGLEAGRRLVALGAQLLIGPPLTPQAWLGPVRGNLEALKPPDAELVATASNLVLEGLTASGLLICADGFPVTDAEQVANLWRAFPHAFAHGLDAVRLDIPPGPGGPERAAHCCQVLRDGLGFTGVIVGRSESAEEAHRLIVAGCDLVQIPPGDRGPAEDAAHAVRSIEQALQRGDLSERRLLEACHRLSDFFDRPFAPAGA